MPFVKTGPAYTTPEVRLVLPDAPWLADAAVSSWSVDRQLVASVVPGTLRQANGLSVGAASVKVINTISRVTPWSPDPDRLVTTDLPAAMLEAVDESGDTLPLGSWVLNPVSGALSSREVDVSLLEAQYAGKQVAQKLPAYTAEPFDPLAPVDPIWAIARLAETAGLHATPPPVESAMLVFPMDGSFMGTVGTPTYEVGGETPGWSTLPDGTVGGESGTFALLVSSASTGGTPVADRLRVGETVYLSVNVLGTFYLADYAGGWQVRIVNDFSTGTHTIGVRNDGASAFVTQTFVPSGSTDWPLRVQVAMTRVWNEDAGQWTSFTARARSGPGAAWSLDATHAVAHAPITDGIEVIYALGGSESVDLEIIDPPPGQFSGLQVTHTDDPALWAPAKALLKPLGGDMGLPWVPPGMDTWTAIQDICSAWLAAAILGNDGILRVLTKDDLAAVAAGDPIMVDVDLEDLPWESDPNDRQDRLELTYASTLIRNAELGTTKLAPEAWRANEVIHVPAGATITVDAELEDRAAVGIFDSFIVPGTTPTPHWSQRSFVSVYATPDGTGAQVPSEQFATQVDQTSATTARITYRNRSGSSQYLVTDADLEEGGGEPSLILHARSVVTYTPALITRGKSVDVATNPLAVDLTPWVQREQDATAIANYLWGRLSSARWKVNGVKCRLDWTLDIGQIRTLTHPGSGLESKVLITSVKYDGKPGQIEQTLDMVLIPWTYADFATAWEEANPGATYADFAAAQGPTRTYEEFSALGNSGWTS